MVILFRLKVVFVLFVWFCIMIVLIFGVCSVLCVGRFGSSLVSWVVGVWVRRFSVLWWLVGERFVFIEIFWLFI